MLISLCRCLLTKGNLLAKCSFSGFRTICPDNRISRRIQYIVQLNTKLVIYLVAILILNSMNRKLCRITITLIIKKLQVHLLTICAIDICIILITQPANGCISGSFRREGLVLIGHYTQRLYFLLQDISGFRIFFLPPLDNKTSTGHSKVSPAVNIEGTVPCKELIHPVAYHKERIPADPYIKRIIGGLGRTLAGD